MKRKDNFTGAIVLSYYMRSQFYSKLKHVFDVLYNIFLNFRDVFYNITCLEEKKKDLSEIQQIRQLCSNSSIRLK